MPRVSDEARAKYLETLRTAVERLCREHLAPIPPAVLVQDFGAKGNKSETRRIQRGLEAAAKRGLLRAHEGEVYSPAVDKDGNRLIWALVTIPS